MYISPNDQQGFIYTHPFFPHHIILKQIPDIISLWKGFTPQCDVVIAVLRSVFFQTPVCQKLPREFVKKVLDAPTEIQWLWAGVRECVFRIS